MVYRRVITLLTIGLLGTILAQPTAAAPASQCFPETSECASGTFLQFWNGNGGLSVFGSPSGEMGGEQAPEGASNTQWSERERFEEPPETRPPYNVLLGRLGDELLRRQGRDWQTFPK